MKEIKVEEVNNSSPLKTTKSKSNPFLQDEISFEGRKLFTAIEKGCLLTPDSLIRNRQTLRGRENLFCTLHSSPEDILFLYSCIRFRQIDVKVFSNSPLKISNFQAFFKEWLERKGYKLDEDL